MTVNIKKLAFSDNKHATMQARKLRKACQLLGVQKIEISVDQAKMVEQQANLQIKFTIAMAALRKADTDIKCLQKLNADLVVKCATLQELCRQKGQELPPGKPELQRQNAYEVMTLDDIPEEIDV